MGWGQGRSRIPLENQVVRKIGENLQQKNPRRDAGGMLILA